MHTCYRVEIRPGLLKNARLFVHRWLSSYDLLTLELVPTASRSTSGPSETLADNAFKMDTRSAALQMGSKNRTGARNQPLISSGWGRQRDPLIKQGGEKQKKILSTVDGHKRRLEMSKTTYEVWTRVTQQGGGQRSHGVRSEGNRHH